MPEALLRQLRHPQHVADAAQRRDLDQGTGILEFAPQPRDLRFERVRFDQVVEAVDRFDQDGAGDDPADALDQRRPGDGDVPLAEALGGNGAVRFAVIEYDNPPGDVFDDIAASLAYLRDGGFVR